MIKLTRIEDVVTEEKNERLPLPPAAPPITSPFPLLLANGANYDLATVSLDLNGDRDGVLLFAVVNWSASFPTSVALVPGSVDITFQFLRNGKLIYEIIETALQPPIAQQNAAVSVPGTTDFQVASLRFLDTAPTQSCPCVLTYTLRAANIVLTPIREVNGTFLPVAAAIGAITLTAEEIEASRRREGERR